MAKAIIIENRMETPTVCVLRLKADIKKHNPGQYVLVYVNNEVKPYSIANTEHGIVELCIKVVPEGHVSNLMSKMKIGSNLELSQPMGMFKLNDTKNKIVFAATGTGISALKPMIDFLAENNFPTETWLFLGVKDEKEIIYRKHFDLLQKQKKNFHFVPVCSRDDKWKGEKGHVQDAIKKLIKTPKEFDIYLCGVKPMVEDLKKIAERMGFANIYFEKYV